MAWPEELYRSVNLNNGRNGDYPSVNNLNFPDGSEDCANLGNGLDVKIYKKSWFKLDETASNF